jgi:hypothetical protein
MITVNVESVINTNLAKIEKFKEITEKYINAFVYSKIIEHSVKYTVLQNSNKRLYMPTNYEALTSFSYKRFGIYYNCDKTVTRNIKGAYYKRRYNI